MNRDFRDYRDYQDFQNEKQKKETKIPKTLDDTILNYVYDELNPSHHKVFSKLVLIQGFVGLMTMLFCPQFNFSLTNNHSLFHYFHMNFGHSICMIICGSIFLGSGGFFAASILSYEEVQKIRNTRLLYYISLSIVAVSSFMLFGADVYLNLLVFWLIGAIGGGIALFEMNHFLRIKLQRFV